MGSTYTAQISLQNQNSVRYLLELLMPNTIFIVFGDTNPCTPMCPSICPCDAQCDSYCPCLYCSWQVLRIRDNRLCSFACGSFSAIVDVAECKVCRGVGVVENVSIFWTLSRSWLDRLKTVMKLISISKLLYKANKGKVKKIGFPENSHVVCSHY